MTCFADAAANHRLSAALVFPSDDGTREALLQNRMQQGETFRLIDQLWVSAQNIDQARTVIPEIA
jgi:hypothetical protein